MSLDATFVRICAAGDIAPEGSVAARPRSTARRWRWCTARTDHSTPSTTSARTPRSRSPRARSTAARWSAGCTARVSTCAPASRTGLPATEPVAVYPVEIRDGDVYVSLTPSNGVERMSTLEIRDLQVSVKLPDGELKPILHGVT